MFVKGAKATVFGFAHRDDPASCYLEDITIGDAPKRNRNDQFTRNIDDATSWLASADSALSGAIDQLHRVRDLVIQARNASADANARQAIASELQSLRAALVGAANTQHAGRPLFGGTAAGGAAYDANGNYVGISMPIERTIAAGQRIQVNVNGDDVFGSAGNDIFTTLSQITTAVASNPAGLDALMTTLDTQIDQVEVSLGEVGARFKRVDDMKSQNTADNLTMKGNLTSIEDADLAERMVGLEAQQVAYQAALTATARAIQPSLADFLR
jgi:flagellar hook-associated protein 3 FlgL